MNTELKEKMLQATVDYWYNKPESHGFDDAFYEGAEWMYAELAPLVEWVSVKDKLPEENKKVLVKYESGFVDIVDGWENKFVKQYGIARWRRIEL